MDFQIRDIPNLVSFLKYTNEFEWIHKLGYPIKSALIRPIGKIFKLLPAADLLAMSVLLALSKYF